MIQIDDISHEGYEKVVRISGAQSGLDCVIAIHNLLNKKNIVALCSIKLESYSSQNLQLEKTLNYADTMSKKTAYAGLPYIGGSITINKDALKSEREALDELSNVLKTYKDSILAFVEYGFEELAIEHLCDKAENVLMIDHNLYFKAQAKGAYYSIRALEQFLSGNKNLKYKHIVINGVGTVGSELAQLLEKAGANITVCDTNKENINNLYAHIHFGTCTPEEAHTVQSSLYILCCEPDQLDKKSTFELQALRVIGVTDSQLSSNKAGYNMHGKNIIYIPEFVAGVGGIISIAKQKSVIKKTLDKELDLIFTRTLSLLNYSSKSRKPPFVVAEQQLVDKFKIKESEVKKIEVKIKEPEAKKIEVKIA